MPRNILRSIQKFQRPIWAPKKVVLVERTLEVEGVTLTVVEAELTVRSHDKIAEAEVKKFSAIL